MSDENKWRVEFESYFNAFDLRKDNEGAYYNDSVGDMFYGYIAARKKAREEIDGIERQWSAECLEVKELSKRQIQSLTQQYQKEAKEIIDEHEEACRVMVEHNLGLERQIKSLTQQLKEKDLTIELKDAQCSDMEEINEKIIGNLRKELSELKSTKELCLWSNQILEIQSLTQQLEDEKKDNELFVSQTTYILKVKNFVIKKQADEIDKLTQQLKEKDEELDNLNNLYVPNIESENEHLKHLIERARVWIAEEKCASYEEEIDWLEDARRSIGVEK